MKESKKNYDDKTASVVDISKQNYSPQVPQTAPQPALDFNALKDKLETFKKAVIKKYNFTISLSLLPVPAYVMFEEDEAVPKEIAETKPLHLVMIVPEEQFKNIPKIKLEVVKLVRETKENLWIHIKTPVDLWNYGLDSKYDFLDAVSQSFPIYDKGFLGALRVASIHKTLVLRKFDKYVASYVIGGSLVRGTAGKDSDVDVFVVIDDTDVKRMSRVELSERLRGMIYEYIREATGLAGVKNILNVQVWLLTDFWQRVKDAEPVAFTFIRDGIPLYDRGTFIPWKLLLKMGKIKPSQEAIDMYMKQGEQTDEFVKRRLLDAMVDIYYGIVTPTQAMMMLAGMAPPTHKESPKVFREEFREKRKIVDEKYVKILEKAVNMFREYEYGKLKQISGNELDLFLKESKDYNDMLKKLRVDIEKRTQESSAEEIYENVFKLLETFFGKKSHQALIQAFEEQMIKKGKIQPRFLKILKELSNAKNKIKSGKLAQRDVDSAKKDAFELINSLIEYGQRADLVAAEKGMMQVSYGNGRRAELVLFGKQNFIIEGKDIKKIESGKVSTSTKEEFEKALAENKGKLSNKVPAEVFAVLQKELGNFELEF